MKEIINKCYRNHIIRELKKTRYPKGVNHLILKSKKKDLMGHSIITHKRKKYTGKYQWKFMEEKKMDFIVDNYHKKCNECGNGYTNVTHVYCPGCGNKLVMVDDWNLADELKYYVLDEKQSVELPKNIKQCRDLITEDIDKILDVDVQLITKDEAMRIVHKYFGDL